MSGARAISTSHSGTSQPKESARRTIMLKSEQTVAAAVGEGFRRLDAALAVLE